MTELRRLSRPDEQQHALSSKLQRFDLTVACVLFVFIFLFYVDVAYVIVPWFSFSVPGMLHLMLLTATTGTALACYFNCMFMDPGRVPKGWLPDDEQQAPVQEVKKKDGAARFCKKCSEYKPPRSHHCRVCERCVLRMDHHCPWVNNCIGHANYRSFFLLLVYCSAALVHTTWLLAAHAMHIAHSSKTSKVIRVGPQATPHIVTGEHNKHLMMPVALQTIAFFVALPTTIAVVMLLIWHIRMVASNKTTIEAAQGVTAQIRAAALGQARSRHPYDLGPWANFHEVLGDNALLWFIPVFFGSPHLVGSTIPRPLRLTAWDSRECG